MASLKVTLEEQEILEACGDYVRKKYNMDPKKATMSFSVSPLADRFDRPTGSHSVSVSMEAEPQEHPRG